MQVQGHKYGSQTLGWALVKARFPFIVSAGWGLIGRANITQLGFVFVSSMAVGDFSYLIEENLLKDFALYPLKFLEMGN